MPSIAHISDLHFGKLDAPIAERLVADLSAHPPTLLVISGDLTQRACVGQYQAAATYLGRLPAPQLVVPGNHDVPLWSVMHRFFAPMGRFVNYIGPELNPVWRGEGLLVVGVNTARAFTRTSGWISRPQLEAITHTFSSADSSVRKVLVTHHPFIPSPKKLNGDILRRAGDSLAELEACGVDLLLAGHLHFSYHDDVRVFHRGANQSVLSIQAGTATSTRRRGEPNAYNWIEFNGEDVHVTVHSWNGTHFEPSVEKHYRRIDGIWEPHGHAEQRPTSAS
jgi:3',5'-cyclic AMP phosphodiesterase CpdA